MIFINMQTSANLLESVIRKILLSEQDTKEEKIKKLKAQWENATHEEQEDRLFIKYTSLEYPDWKWDKEKQAWVPKDQDDSIDDSSTDDSDSDQEQTPDESWLGRPVPPPDQYNGKNGDASKNGLFNNEYLVGKGRTIKVELSKEAMFSFDRLYNSMPKAVKQDITQIYSFRTYETQYNLVDWKHWKETGEWKTVKQNGKVFPVAKPGTSNHGIGDAIDIYPAGVQAWMEAKAKYYGWYNKVKGDRPHFKYSAEKDLSAGSIETKKK